MAVKEPVDPCMDCRHKDSCRLPLSCDHHLRYMREKQQYRQDSYELRRCGILKTTARQELKITKRRNLEAAKAHPWRPAEEKTMPAKSKIDDTRANDLYTDGLTDLQMAECLGVTRAAVQAWRKRNGLSINKAAYPPIEMEEQMENATVIQPVPVDLPETDKTLLRIQKLLSLRCDEDSRCIKNLFSELAVAMLRTGLEDKPERKEEKDDG